MRILKPWREIYLGFAVAALLLPYGSYIKADQPFAGWLLIGFSATLAVLAMGLFATDHLRKKIKAIRPTAQKR